MSDDRIVHPSSPVDPSGKSSAAGRHFRDSLLREISRMAPAEEQQAAFEFILLFDGLRRYEDKAKHSMALYKFSEELGAPVREAFGSSRPPRMEHNSMHEFNDAIAAYNASEAVLKQQSDQYRAWMGVAVRDTVMSIFHYVEIFKAIDGFWPKMLPSLRGKIDFVSKKSAEQTLLQAYLYASDLRHSVAHEGEFSTPSKSNEHRVSDFTGFGVQISGGAWQVSDTIANDVYLATFEGRAVHLPLKADHAATLGQITDKMIDAFTTSVSDEIRRHHLDVAESYLNWLGGAR